MDKADMYVFYHNKNGYRIILDVSNARVKKASQFYEDKLFLNKFGM